MIEEVQKINQMRVIIYPRVSSGVQAKRDSIPAQINRLKKFCEEREYEVVDIYIEDGKSASLKEERTNLRVTNKSIEISFDLNQRPALKKIIHEAGNGKFDAIVFYKWDRFSRSVIYAKVCKIYFDSKNIKLIPSDDSEEPLTSSIMQILSEEEVRKTKERIKLSRLKRFEDGMMVAKTPYGYSPVKKDGKVIRHKEHPKHSKIVKDIFNMALNGCSYKEICKKHKIKPQQYYNIIRNKVYIGLIEFEGKVKKGNHPILVNEDIFRKVNGR